MGNRHDNTGLAVAVVLSSLGAMLVAAGSAWAATAAEQERAAAGLVREGLEHEMAGRSSEREHALSAALAASPKHQPALWHTGHVKFDNQWFKFYQVPEMLEGRANLAAYRAARDNAAPTVDAQLELADWCAKRKLLDQERAHLTKVLELDPDQAAARRRLGFVRVDNMWLNQHEVRKSGKQAELAAAAFKKWQPKLETIHNGFKRRDPRQREAAAKLLEAIDDPAAIPAMEVLLSTSSPEEAQAVIETLSNMPAPEASVSLARHAVLAQAQETREAAADALRHRDEQSFVPELLAALSTPIQSRAELYAGPGGRLMYSHAFYREGQERKDVADLLTAFHSGDGSDPRAMGTMLATLAAREREAAVAAQNNRTQQLNERICWVLARATSYELGASPESWWSWWNHFNEVYVSGEKPVALAYRVNEVSLASSTAPAPTTSDCLAAGTPVWTDTGSVAIEKIQVGDRVLAQDPESGELAYKPVLRTTIRPAGPLMEVQVGRETLRCSGGHPLWVSGSGWVKARKLQPGMVLHGPAGAASVTAVEQRGVEETYNLVVADFNTYFVGRVRVLSHDNTLRRPTAALVPGLASAR